MDFYTISKELLIPLVSPLIAILTLIIYAKQERRKIAVQVDIDLKKAIHAVERDVLSLREAYQVVSLMAVRGETIEPERIAVINEITDRIFKKLSETPAIYDQYFSKVKAKIQTDRIPLLLTELQIRLRLLAKSPKKDNIILFGLYMLLYARTPSNSDTEEQKILQELYNSDPNVFAAWWRPHAYQ